MTTAITIHSHSSRGTRTSSVWRAFGTVFEWRERSRQRWALRHLDDRMLCDLGLTRADVYGETAKPFWRA